MSMESDIRQVLISYAPLTAVVPAGRISIDAVMQTLPRPYVVFSKQSQQTSLGLNGTNLGTIASVDIQCIGNTRTEAIAVADLVRDALVLAGQPSENGSAGYDPENDIEAEIVSVSWINT